MEPWVSRGHRPHRWLQQVELTLAVDPTQVPLLNSSNTFGQNLTESWCTLGRWDRRCKRWNCRTYQNGVGSFKGNGFTLISRAHFLSDMQSTTRNQAGSIVALWISGGRQNRGNTMGQPSGSMNLLYGANNSTPAETGFSVNANGQINAPGSLDKDVW